MSNQLIFILGALSITGLVLPLLMSSLLRKPEQQAPAQHTANAAIYQQQLADLQLDYETGKLTESAWTQAQDELTRRLLQETEDSPVAAVPAAPSRALITAMLLGVLLPVGAVTTYLTLGQPGALDLPSVASADTNPAPELQTMADSLARKLATEGGSVQRWVMLARTYRTLAQYDKALPAYTQAVSAGGDEDVQLERAEVLAVLHDGNFQGEPLQVIERILRENPNHYHALLLAGSAAYAGEQYQRALNYWQKAKVQLQAGDGDVEELNQAIAKAEEKLGPGPRQRPVAPSSAHATLGGRVELGDLAKGQVTANDTVFIYAVATQGPRTPVAILRTTVSQLPMSFVLDDSTAMNAEHKLSAQSAVWLKARVSKSGEAMPKPGDWLGTLGPLTPGTANLHLVINERLP